MSARPVRSRLVGTAAVTAVAALTLTGCLAGENAEAGEPADTLAIDYATYNPLSLVIKDKGWLEAAVADQDVDVEWVFSAGSNKANEMLRAEAVDVGSTAGSAALLARANGSPIQVIDLYSQPEWSALVTTPGSGIDEVADLAGKSVAATKGTDPYFFLVQALNEAGLSTDDVTVQNIQHADGYTALTNGDVDAWAGLDPIMASAEANGAELFYRNIDFNTYGFLNASETFVTDSPELAQTVVDVYAYARDWAQANIDETTRILADEAGIEEDTAAGTIERTHLDIDHVPGPEQLAVLERIGPTLVETGDVSSQEQVDQALATIVNDEFATAADPAAVAEVIEQGES